MEAAHTSWRSLGELFVERGLISEADLERALAEQVATKRRLADILVRRGLVTGHDITNALMEQLGDEAPMQPTTKPPVAPATAPVAPPTRAAAPVPAPAPVAEHLEGAVVPMPEATPPIEIAPAAAAAAAEVTVAPAEQTSRKKAAPEKEPEAVVPAGYDLSISAHALIAEADSRRRGAEAELAAAREAHAQVLRGLEQVRAELEARDLSTDSLANELEETQARLRNREDELSNEVATWEEARREAERCGGQLAELQSRFEEKQHELSEASASAAAWTARASELETETETLAHRVTAAVHAIEVLATTRFAANGADLMRQGLPGNGQKSSGQAGVLYFVPQAEGYDLVERNGALPSVGETLEFGEQPFVVTKIGRSPLPFDRRSCVFLTAV
jgi:hypothetical protein